MKKLCGVVAVSIMLMGASAAPAAAAPDGVPARPDWNALCKVFPRLCL